MPLLPIHLPYVLYCTVPGIHHLSVTASHYLDWNIAFMHDVTYIVHSTYITYLFPIKEVNMAGLSV